MTFTTSRLALTLPAAASSVRAARLAAGGAATEAGFDEREVDDVRLCVSEAVSNVVRHAYPDATGDVVVTVEEREGELLVVVRDRGCGLGEIGAADTDGGFGLRIIERLARRVTVASTAAEGTEVAMVFVPVRPSPGRAR